MFDIFHAQIMDGNIIKLLDQTWDQISFIQIADNPRRVEPGTGEINYVNILNHIKSKEYKGLIEFEHGSSKFGIEGEKAVIESWTALNQQIN
jgi:hydroxypyruvate isomerase